MQLTMVPSVVVFEVQTDIASVAMLELSKCDYKEVLCAKADSEDCTLLVARLSSAIHPLVVPAGATRVQLNSLPEVMLCVRVTLETLKAMTERQTLVEVLETLLAIVLQKAIILAHAVICESIKKECLVRVRVLNTPDARTLRTMKASPSTVVYAQGGQDDIMGLTGGTTETKARETSIELELRPVSTFNAKLMQMEQEEIRRFNQDPLAMLKEKQEEGTSAYVVPH
jgi:hypothetical protein